MSIAMARSNRGRKRIAVVSLGCPKNQVDSEVALGCFRRRGFRVEADPEKADVIVVNTCAFIRAAEAESVQALSDALRLKSPRRKRRIVVTGCLVSRYGAPRLRAWFPELDAATPPHDTERLLSAVAPGNPGIQDVPRERIVLSRPGTAYLKIAEGCSRACSFCLIPRLRGPLCSRPPDAVVEEAAQLAQHGIKELVLIAQDITQYGRDRSGRPALVGLLDRLVRIPKLRWLRLMYANPEGVSPELIARIAREAKICKYLDMPLQHCDAAILRRMGRGGQGEGFLTLISRLRQAIPGLALRTTLISGFPGEDEAAHQRLLRFIAQAQFDRLGVFAYSRETGTRAALLSGPVHPSTRQRRRRELMLLQADISRQRLVRRVGRVIHCLVEEPSGSQHVIARTAWDAPDIDGGIVLAGRARPGDLVRARVTGSTDHDLIGAIV